MKICIVSFIVAKAFHTPLNNFKQVISEISDEVTLITGNIDGYSSITKDDKKTKTFEFTFKKDNNIFLQLSRYLKLQIDISRKVLYESEKTDCFIFFMEGVGILPMLAAKIIGKKIIWMIPSSILLKNKDILKKHVYRLFSLTQNISGILANRIVVYSPNLIKEWDLDRFSKKIRIAHEHFLDFNAYSPDEKIEERKIVVGHIGRLSEEKGTMNFVKAIPNIVKNEKNIQFLIGGDGELKLKIKKYLSENKLNGHANLVGWISKKDLPSYLNKLKLIVLASYTEGLPNIMLESMACGTPVLATPVGAIPDVIKNDKTGFILDDNSPEGIERAVLRVVKLTNLKKISENARKRVKKDFDFKNTVKRYKAILDELF